MLHLAIIQANKANCCKWSCKHPQLWHICVARPENQFHGFPIIHVKQIFSTTTRPTTHKNNNQACCSVESEKIALVFIIFLSGKRPHQTSHKKECRRTGRNRMTTTQAFPTFYQLAILAFLSSSIQISANS